MFYILVAACSRRPPFREVLRETPLFLPGTFRDCGFLEGVFFCTTLLSKSRKESFPASEKNRTKKGKESSQALPRKHQICEKAFREVLRETVLFLPGTFRDCGVLVCSKTPDFLDKKCQQLARTTS